MSYLLSTAGVVGLILAILVIVCVVRCVVTKRQRRKGAISRTPSRNMRNYDNDPDGYYDRTSHKPHEMEELVPRAPSPAPPSVPPRPVSYTPRSGNQSALSHVTSQSLCHSHCHATIIYLTIWL